MFKSGSHNSSNQDDGNEIQMLVQRINRYIDVQTGDQILKPSFDYNAKKPGVGQKFLKKVQKFNWYIYEVEERSPASEAGLQVGDQILSVDGKSVVGITANRFLDIWGETGHRLELEVDRHVAVFQSRLSRRWNLESLQFVC